MSQAPAHPDIREPEPAWAVAKLFPPQGQWSEQEYLSLTDSTNRLVELVDGRLEVLPVPTTSPQIKKNVVLRLKGKKYVTHSEAGETGEVRSALLEGFTADAAQVWAAGKL